MNVEQGPKEAKIPQWLEEYKTAYRAYLMVEDSMEGELGNYDREGKIGMDFQKDYAKTFFNGINPIASALPEYIQYYWIRPPRPTLYINDVMISGPTFESDYYYLPQRDSIYKVAEGSKDDPRFIPGDPEFVGLDHISEQHEWGVHVQPLSHYEHLERVANPLDISINGLDLIVSKAEEALRGKPEHASITELAKTLSDLKQQTEGKEQEAREKYIPQLRQRVFNLLDFYQKYPSFYKKLPRAIKGQYIFDEEYRKGNQRRNYLIKDTRELVRVPVKYKKPIFGIIERDGENIELSKAEPAPDSDWITTSGYFVLQMSNSLPWRRGYQSYLYRK